MLIIREFTTDKKNGLSTILVEEIDRFTRLIVELKTKEFLNNLYNIQKTECNKYSIKSVYGNNNWIIKLYDNDTKIVHVYVHEMICRTTIFK